MSGKIAAEVATTSSAATAATGSVTVASSAGFYAGAFVHLSKAGASVLCRVVAVPDATHITVRQELDPRGGGVGTDQTMIRANAGYGFFDATAYVPGAVNQPLQVVYNPNESPLV